MDHSQLIADRFESVCSTILTDSRNELYVNMRYLDLALSGLRFQVTTQYPAIGTDGAALYVNPKVLVDLYQENRMLVNRVYLHCVMHCLLRHIVKTPRGDALLWRISCDIAVESIIDSMHARSIRTGISRLRMDWYAHLHQKLKVLTAEGVYRVLAAEKLTPFQLTSLKESFCIDDHSLWPVPDSEGRNPPPMMTAVREKWDDLSQKTQTEMETFGHDQAQGAGDLLEDIRVENRERYDYKAFLRKFAVMREEMQVDPDTFDYVFYTFGLSLYGNMPLIEPQEYKEVKRIQDFVIVVDVSLSTSGDLVKMFLEQTYSVLTESETYLKKVNIRILQCDEQVREDVKITGREELEAYMEHFTLKGGGGTDFRPAFAYVEELIAHRQFTNLRGLIYFTDGKGIYPKKRPPFDAAFVFMEEDYEDRQVPPWAIRLIIDKEQIEEEAQGLRTDYTFV